MGDYEIETLPIITGRSLLLLQRDIHCARSLALNVLKMLRVMILEVQCLRYYCCLVLLPFVQLSTLVERKCVTSRWNLG